MITVFDSKAKENATQQLELFFKSSAKYYFCIQKFFWCLKSNLWMWIYENLWFDFGNVTAKIAFKKEFKIFLEPLESFCYHSILLGSHFSYINALSPDWISTQDIFYLCFDVIPRPKLALFSTNVFKSFWRLLVVPKKVQDVPINIQIVNHS